MNTTKYKNPVRSPIQRIHPAKQWGHTALDVHNPKHPVRKEIEKCVGRFDLTLHIEEDERTLSAMKTTRGLISFLCTLVDQNGNVLSQGVGSSVLNGTNRFIERTVQSAFNSSIADCVIRSTKVLNTFFPATEEDIKDAHEAKAHAETEPASEKQIGYLKRLAIEHLDNEDEREQLLSSLSELTKQEASAMIGSFQE